MALVAQRDVLLITAAKYIWGSLLTKVICKTKKYCLDFQRIIPVFNEASHQSTLHWLFIIKGVWVCLFLKALSYSFRDFFCFLILTSEARGTLQDGLFTLKVQVLFQHFIWKWECVLKRHEFCKANKKQIIRGNSEKRSFLHLLNLPRPVTMPLQTGVCCFINSGRFGRSAKVGQKSQEQVTPYWHFCLSLAWCKNRAAQRTDRGTKTLWTFPTTAKVPFKSVPRSEFQTS